MKAHLNLMIRLHDELKGMGASITNKEFVTFILGSLPLSYRMLMSLFTLAMRAAGKDVDLSDLMKIITEEATH
jgi:hypothetical protein